MIGLINNPIIARELLGLLRTRRAAALQVILVASMAVLLLLRWPVDSQVDLEGKRAQEVLIVFGYGLMTLMVLLAPVFPATSIVRERQQGTLALLLNSPMTRMEIFTGKLIGVMGFGILLLILSLPAAVACYAMGGVGLWDQLGWMYIVLFLLALQYSTLGLLVSSFALRVDAALRITYGFFLLFSVVALGPYYFLHAATWMTPPLSMAIEWIRCLSPVPALAEILGQSDFTQRGLMEVGHSPARFAMLAGGSSIFFAAWTAMRLQSSLFDSSRDAGKITDDLSTGVRFYRRIMYLWFFDPQRRSGLIGPLTNPVMVKEFRTRKYGRAGWMVRLFMGCLLLSLGLMLATTRGTLDWGPQTLGSILVLLSGALIVLVTPSLASSIIAGERESGGWTLLQMTPLSAWTIITGKLLSAVWTVLLLILAMFPAYLVLLKIDASGEIRPRMPMVIMTLVLTAAFSVLLSAAVSSLCKRTATATAVAYAILVTLCVGTLLIWLGRDAPFSARLVEQALWFNPLSPALVLIDAPGFTGYHVVPMGWYIVGGMSVICLLVLWIQTWRLMGDEK